MTNGLLIKAFGNGVMVWIGCTITLITYYSHLVGARFICILFILNK
jgi:hypothetical protein